MQPSRIAEPGTQESLPAGAAGRAGGEAGPRRFSRAYRLRRKLRRLSNELRNHLAERAKAPTLASYPVWVNLNHTTVCNLRCVMCQQSLTPVTQGVMDRALYRRVRDELFDHVSELSLTVMGDPFCVPKPFLREILDDVERFDLRLEITTNALLLGDEEELGRLVQLVDKLVISVDAATPQTYERIRRPGKWDRLVGNLERLQRARRRLLPWRRPLLDFNFVLLNSNLAELPDFIDLAAGWDAHAVNALVLIDFGPGIAHEAPDPRSPEVLAAVTEARRRALRHGLSFHVSGPELEQAARRVPASWRQRALQGWATLRPVFNLGTNYLVERALRRVKVARRECSYLWGRTYVWMDGHVATCCSTGLYITGDLSRDRFQDIWNGRRYRGLRASLNSAHPAAGCKDCALLRT